MRRSSSGEASIACGGDPAVKHDGGVTYQPLLSVDAGLHILELGAGLAFDRGVHAALRSSSELLDMSPSWQQHASSSETITHSCTIFRFSCCFPTQMSHAL